jgi:hypothetical protein
MDNDDAKALIIICVMACFALFVIGAIVGSVATKSQIRSEMIQKEIGSWAITKTGEKYFASDVELLK